MTPASAERLARRVHRWDLDESGLPFVSHLERVVAQVITAGGPREQMAVWLHALPKSSAAIPDSVARRIPPAVLRIIDAVAHRPGEPYRAHAARISSCPGADLVLHAFMTDKYRPGTTIRRYVADYDRALLSELRLPLPTVLSAPWPARDLPVSKRPLPTGPDMETSAPSVPANEPGQSRSIEWALAQDNARIVAEALRALSPDQVTEVFDQVAVIARRQGPRWSLARATAMNKLTAAPGPRVRDFLAEVRAEMLEDVAARGLRDPAAVRDLIVDQDSRVVPALIAQLWEGAPGMAGAAFILGEKRAGEAVPALVSALYDGVAGGKAPFSYFHAVCACITALAKIADSAAVPALAETCHKGRAPATRSLALEALRRFDDPALTEIGLAAAEDPDPDVRTQAVRLLAARGDARAVPRLLVACDGSAASIALRGLARLGDERSVLTLVRLMRSETDRAVLHLAGRALARSARKDPQLYPGMLPLPQLLACIWVLGELRIRERHPTLQRFLTHRHEAVRARTAAALGKIGDPASAKHLAAALGDISPRVRAAAAAALGFVASAADPDMREQAMQALRPLVADEQPTVRLAANAALDRLSAAPSPPEPPGLLR